MTDTDSAFQPEYTPPPNVNVPPPEPFCPPDAVPFLPSQDMPSADPYAPYQGMSGADPYAPSYAMPGADPYAPPQGMPSYAPGAAPYPPSYAMPDANPSAMPPAMPAYAPGADPYAAPYAAPPAMPGTMPSATPYDAAGAMPYAAPPAVPGTMPSATPYDTPYPLPYPELPRVEETPKKKRSKVPFIIAAAVVLVAALGVGGYFAFNAFQEAQRESNYSAAISLMDQGDYEAARSKFEELGDYQNSSKNREYCNQAIQYNEASTLFDEGQYTKALDLFLALGSFKDSAKKAGICEAWLAFEEAKALTEAGKFEEAADMVWDFAGVPDVYDSEEVFAWQDANDYGLADLLFKSGQMYKAYQAFSALGSYRDAAERAQNCLTPMPGTAELYRNEAFVSSASELTFDATATPYPTYIKIYSGEALVSSVFLQAGSSLTIPIPAGDFTFKRAFGEQWFGETELFGDDGTYTVMLLDGSNEVIHLDSNMIYTITLYVVAGGNVSNQETDRDGF
ncbi:MAG: hypothetical protein LBG81_03360 [Coriobacteriaceae bacterium]|jgi:hypothetical protein|nr:hypothetical protein [Coriobacteriaceae bacterium]